MRADPVYSSGSNFKPVLSNIQKCNLVFDPRSAGYVKPCHRPPPPRQVVRSKRATEDDEKLIEEMKRAAEKGDLLESGVADVAIKVRHGLGLTRRRVSIDSRYTYGRDSHGAAGPAVSHACTRWLMR